MITLRPDQAETVDRLREALSRHQSVLLRGACGFGKTVVAAYMASGANAKNKRVIFGVHRIELARQTELTFEKFGIPFGYIMAGKPSNPLARVQIASVDTLRRRPALIGCDLFIPDEAHLWSGASRKAIIDQVRKDGAHIVPLTATPMFPDGRAIGDMADAIVSGPSERWLIEQGHLARYRAFAPAVMDMAGIHTRMGDYVVADLEERFSKPRLYGDAVAAYRKFADGRRMIGYCYSRKHGGEMAAAFTAAGVPAAFIDGETPDAERRRVIADFADGRVPVLMNCQLFREGFDLSAQVGRDVPIQAVGLYNPTKSLPLAIQMMMRGMRPQAEPSIILDHANVLRDHGLPDDDREWSLEGAGRKKKQMDPTIPTTTCGSCWATFRPSQPCCPYCGHKRDIHDRQIEVITEAQIEEIDPDLVRQARRAEQDKVNLRVRSARSLNDLCRVAIELGRNAGWVYNVYRNRPDGRRDLPYAAVVRAMKEAA
jgi:superfamily II DNA or RNA helicase